MTKVASGTSETLVDLNDLYPNLTEPQYAALDSWYAGYAALIVRMYERIASDPEAHARFLQLTTPALPPRMSGKVDSPNLNHEN